MYLVSEKDYLAHHGIKGQKWGVEHGPPYPVRRGAGGAPKKTSIIKSRLKASSEARAEKRAVKKEESAKEKHEKLKQQVIKHPKDLYKLQNEFSKSEIESIIKDIEFDRKIKDVRTVEIKRGMEAYGRLKEASQITFQFMDNAKKIYNILAEVNNARIDAGKSNGKRMVKLGDNPKSDSESSSSSDNSSVSNNKGSPQQNQSKSGQTSSSNASSPGTNKAQSKPKAGGVKTQKWVQMSPLDVPMAAFSPDGSWWTF